MKRIIAGALSGVLAVAVGILATKGWQDHKKLKVYEAAMKAPRPETLLTLTNRTLLNIGNAIILQVSDDEWMTLTNGYPTNIRTDTLTFYKEPRK